ncbi:MAG: HAD family hydrolase [Opitutae bacterium]|nr:HAD family hydrolase [Opitutae bacterium]MCD8298140.1 HAD family hydrolase [Opitutae bacterium]
MKKVSEYAHVVWDWNGTLLDDFWLCLKALNDLLATRQKPPVSAEFYREIFDFPVIKAYERLGFELPPGEFEKISAFFMDIYEAHRWECTLHKGARRFVHKLAALGLTQSVLSAYRHDRLQEIIAEHDLEKYFVRLSGNDDIYGNDKSYRAAGHLKKLGLPATSVLYVGDTLHDVETARAMGVDCVLIDWGETAHMARERLLAAGVPVVRDYTELL